ncbi:hypothetical protein BH09BAC2_BH09BAC2_02730 [soil metagenome]
MRTDVNSKGVTYPGQFGMFMGLTGIGVIAGSFLSAGIWIMMTHESMQSMASNMLNAKYYNATMMVQVVSSVLIFFLPVYIFAIICYYKPAAFIGFNLNITGRQVALICGILILTFPLAGAIAELNKILPIPAELAAKFKKMEDARKSEESALIQINSVYRYLISLLVIAFLPALVEETFFRGGLQNILTRWIKNPWMAIIITAILFSLIHISYYGFLVRFALGVILGAIFYLTGNIWLNILFHFLFNGLQVTALYAYNGKNVADKPDIDNGFPLWIGLVALMGIVFLFEKLIKNSPVALLDEDEYDDDTERFDDYNNTPNRL